MSKRKLRIIDLLREELQKEAPLPRPYSVQMSPQTEADWSISADDMNQMTPDQFHQRINQLSTSPQQTQPTTPPSPPRRSPEEYDQMVQRMSAMTAPVSPEEFARLTDPLNDPSQQVAYTPAGMAKLAGRTTSGFTSQPGQAPVTHTQTMAGADAADAQQQAQRAASVYSLDNRPSFAMPGQVPQMPPGIQTNPGTPSTQMAQGTPGINFGQTAGPDEPTKPGFRPQKAVVASYDPSLREMIKRILK